MRLWHADPAAFERTVTLPDGRSVVLGKERFEAPEVLLQHEMRGAGLYGGGAIPLGAYVARLLKERTPCELRDTFASNVVLSGGGAFYAGLPQRLQMDLKEEGGGAVVHTANDRHSTWRGGCVYAKARQHAGLTKEEWEETGQVPRMF